MGRLSCLRAAKAARRKFGNAHPIDRSNSASMNVYFVESRIISGKLRQRLEMVHTVLVLEGSVKSSKS